MNEATVELEDGLDMSWPIEGSLSSNGVEGVLKAGRSNTCSIDGRRNESLAWGLGRIAVASAEAVVDVLGSRNAWRSSKRCRNEVLETTELLVMVAFWSCTPRTCGTG